jgi:hypothetical protein
LAGVGVVQQDYGGLGVLGFEDRDQSGWLVGSVQGIHLQHFPSLLPLFVTRDYCPTLDGGAISKLSTEAVHAVREKATADPASTDIDLVQCSIIYAGVMPLKVII